jgi:hypothetical protein
MKLQIKQYEYEKKEVESKEIQLPSETSYFFQTHIRRSIKIIPCYTTWNKERYNKEEELYELVIICLYQSSECKIEKFTILARNIEEIYYSNKHEHKDFITALIDGEFDERTKEQFDADFNTILTKIQCI